MIRLSKGGNAPIEATDLVVTVDVGAEADLSALLLGASGKVRSDADFVFFNQPTGPGVRCLPPADGRPWQVAVDTTAVPADVQTVRVVSSLDSSAVDRGTTFGRVAEPVARVADASGTPLAEFTLSGLDREVIVVAFELYRRDATWKLRAVGQGYAGGLADLVTDAGVSVDDQPAAPPPPPVVAAAPPPPPVVAAPPPPPVVTPPPPVAPPPPPVVEPVEATPPPPAAPPPPAYSAGAPPSTGEISLTKGRPVSLTKGQKVTLTKDGGRALTQVRMGLGWDQIQKKGGLFGSHQVDIDLDASAVLFAGTQVADVAFYNNLATRDGSIRHLGDNRTGAGDGDDETIDVDLTAIPAQVTTVVFVVTSYQGQTFEQVQNAFCRLVDHTDGELARFTLAGGMPFTGLVMAKLTRAGATWRFEAIGDGIMAKVPTEAIKQLDRYL